MTVEAERRYYPENWEPLKRWLPASHCWTRFGWMWHQQGFECYRYRDTGELLYLDSMGQCWDMTELGPLPADFAEAFQRCTRTPYTDEVAAAARDDAEDADFDEDEEYDDDSPAVEPPNGCSLSQLVGEWAEKENIDPAKLQRLLCQIQVHTTMLAGELEGQCQTLLKTTQCWLR
jgi:hypothetical protein